MLEPENDNNSINPLYLVINRLFGHIEKIEGSSDRYLVVNINNEKIINVFDKLWKFIENEKIRNIKIDYFFILLN